MIDASDITIFPYISLGGEATLQKLVESFYRHWETLHKTDASESARYKKPQNPMCPGEKLYMFLSGWLGGPDLYAEHCGAPFLRARHMPYMIGTPECDRWMHCMACALDDAVPNTELREKLKKSLLALVKHVGNTSP